MTLGEALNALTPALIATPRFAAVTAQLGNGTLVAYNGEVLGLAPIDTDAEVMINAERLTKVWLPGATLKVNDKQVTVSHKRVQYRLNRLFEEPPIPPWVADHLVVELSEDQVEAILLAAKFASSNAVHAWACGVSIGHNGIIATNNQTLVYVPCPFDYELTLPFWAVNLLNRKAKPPDMSVNENMIKFTWSDGVVLQAQRLAVDMPPSVFQLAESLTEQAPDPVQLSDLMEEMDQLDSHMCRLTPEGLFVETRDNEQAVSDVCFNGTFKLTVETARLVFSHATHIGFASTPARLHFSKATHPRLIGFAAGMS